MTDAPPIILWFRRDLRLGDHPALHAARATGRPVIPVFVHDEVVEGLGAAAKWRFGLGIAAFAERLEGIGARLVLRRGGALEVLEALVAETGADTVWWTRAYDPPSIARDAAVKAALETRAIEARSHPGHLLFEPWSVETRQGGHYKVYTAYWRAVRGRGVGSPLAAPRELPAPGNWPASDVLESWKMGAAMDRGAAVVARHAVVGEQAAEGRLATFMEERIGGYAGARDRPGVAGTSNLSENLTYGEISVRTCWQAGQRALEEGRQGAESFLRELCWREFAYHLLYHTPRLASGNWRPEWDSFPWNEDERVAEVVAWKQGRTGVPFVDAAMREMWVTGRMHNRARMVAASYLCKHLMTHWRIGLRWFEGCLIDWDPASNALGWQWVAGPGPDATPYFRVFNPSTQADRFDRDRAYVDRFIAEGREHPHPDAVSYFDAIPWRWPMAITESYPAPIIDHNEGRARALNAYENRNF